MLKATIHNFFSQSNKYLVLFCIIIMVFVLGYIDFILGPEISFSIFYIIPILLTTWYLNKKNAYYIAVISSIIWLAADIFTREPYSNSFIPLWNALVRLAFFLIILELLSTLKEELKTKNMLADTDPLTGLANRRLFNQQLNLEINRAERYPEPYTLVYLDLDNFKFVNDNLGHETGDKLLQTVANYFKLHIRNHDTAARLGGDEFALLFPKLNAEAAIVKLNNHQKALLALMNDKHWPVTFSIGAITFNEPMKSINDTIKSVDELMYQVKKSSKNNILHQIWPAK